MAVNGPVEAGVSPCMNHVSGRHGRHYSKEQHGGNGEKISVHSCPFVVTKAIDTSA
jgi:hypothetical protein